MANLLPREAYKRMSRFYESRVLSTISLVAFVLAILAALALTPSYLALEYAAPQSPGVSGERAAGDDVTSIARTRALMRRADPLLSQEVYPTDLMRIILDGRPSGVVVDRISYAAGRVTLAGHASREGVSAYREFLTAEELFETVVVPVGALIGAEGGRFSITLSGEF